MYHCESLRRYESSFRLATPAWEPPPLTGTCASSGLNSGLSLKLTIMHFISSFLLTDPILTMLLYVHRSEVAYRDGDGGGCVCVGGGGKRAREWRLDRGYRPKRPWTTARTMEVLRQCPLAIAQRLVHRAVAVSAAVLGRVTRTRSVALLLRNNSKRKKSNFRSPAPPPCS